MSDARVRLVLVVDDELREALRLEAARQGRNMADLVSEWIRETCADSLAEVRARQPRKTPPGEG